MLWNNISNQINNLNHGLSNLGKSKAGHTRNKIIQDLNNCYQNIIEFKMKNPFLPDKELSELNDSIEKVKNLLSGLNDPNTVNPLKEDFIVDVVTYLNSINSFVLSHMSVRNNLTKSVEFAFAHLQRLIVADCSTKEKWEQVWQSREKEREFESLGGLHLLSHKIWAFKVDAKGEKTDLVLNLSLDTTDPLFNSSSGLVLTEWKIVNDPRKVNEQIDQAKRQAALYRYGTLGVTELTNYSYLIMISRERLSIESEKLKTNEGGIEYRVINIATAPRHPSNKSG